MRLVRENIFADEFIVLNKKESFFINAMSRFD